MAFLNIKYHLNLETEEINGKRYYQTPDGLVPSMTTILSNYNKDVLDRWRTRVGDQEANRIATNAANQGTSIHNLCEAYVKGEVLPECNPFEKARFNQLKPIIDNNIQDVYACETALYSNRLKLAGRTDVIGKYKHKNSIIDYKTSRRLKKIEWVDSYWMQEAGYAIMWAERVGVISLMPEQLVLIISVEHEQPQILTQPVGPWVKKLTQYLKEINHL